MKRTTALAALAALAISLPLRGRAQDDDDSDATPAPIDPNMHTYSDDGMSMTVPPEYRLVRLGPAVSPTNLADKPILVAVWVAQKPHVFQISLNMVAYDGDVGGFNTQYENQLREGDPNLMVHNHTLVKLSNGMPAFWIMSGTGAEFHLERLYSLIWADGLRGCVITYAGQLDQVDEKVAKLALSNVSAVVYPKDR